MGQHILGLYSLFDYGDNDFEVDELDKNWFGHILVTTYLIDNLDWLKTLGILQQYLNHGPDPNIFQYAVHIVCQWKYWI